MSTNIIYNVYHQLSPEESDQQNQWFEEEIEQSKLCSTHLVVFCYHPWFLSHIDEEDDNNINTSSCFPKLIRLKWLKKLRHHKVRLMISSAAQKCITIEGKSSPKHPFPKKGAKSSAPPLSSHPIDGVEESFDESIYKHI